MNGVYQFLQVISFLIMDWISVTHILVIPKEKWRKFWETAIDLCKKGVYFVQTQYNKKLFKS
jgi:diadenosine tetraphosphate (Ap4A) HIT family hydrolase